MMLDSVSYLDDGMPLECYHVLHRGDRALSEVELVCLREQGKRDREHNSARRKHL